MGATSFETLDLDNCSLIRLSEILTRIAMRGCTVHSWDPSDSTNGFHVTVACSCGACRLVFDDQTRYSRDLNRPVYAQNVLFDTRRRKLYLTRETGCEKHLEDGIFQCDCDRCFAETVGEAGGLTD